MPVQRAGGHRDGTGADAADRARQIRHLVWVSVVLGKFIYGRPSYRLVQDLADQGLALSMGTLTGRLQAIAPLFVPLYEELLEQLRSAAHWNADETRWAVFVDLEGKCGHRWYLWVFQSSGVAY